MVASTLSLTRLAIAGFRRRRLEPPFTAGSAKIGRLVLMLQSECALRCRMCDHWLQDRSVFPLASVAPLFQSPALAKDASIHFTGGEPLMYPGFAALYSTLRLARPEVPMSISTSGVPHEAVVAFLRSRPDLEDTTLAFSFDGPGVHDRQRGMPGAEIELERSLNAARTLAPDASVMLVMTITPWNCHAVLDAADWARERGLGLRLALARRAPAYTNSKRAVDLALDEDQKARLRADLAEVFNETHPLREGRELSHRLALIEELEGRPAAPSRCRSAFIRSDGALLTCRSAEPVGSVLTQTLQQAWEAGASRPCACCDTL